MGLHSCGSLSLSVTVIWRKDPMRVNADVFSSNDIVTEHSESRDCFRSKHAAKAQPTAWLNLSPWWNIYTQYFDLWYIAAVHWHIVKKYGWDWWLNEGVADVSHGLRLSEDLHHYILYQRLPPASDSSPSRLWYHVFISFVILYHHYTYRGSE